MKSPLPIPGGWSILIVLVTFCKPDPLHFLHKCSIVLPDPLQCLQGCIDWEIPNGVRWVSVIIPVPLQWGQSLIPEPPSPLHSVQRVNIWYSISLCTPL